MKNRAEEKYNMACQIRKWSGKQAGQPDRYGTEAELRAMTYPELVKIYLNLEKEETSTVR